MPLQPSRVGAAAAIGLHAIAAAALLAYEPARTALIAAAPIMVDWIAAPRAERAPETPKPRPVQRAAPRAEPPTLAQPAAAPEPAPAVASVSPAPASPAPAPAALAVTEPVFDAAYLDNPAPAYPALSRRMHEEGRVVLRVLVSAAGRADDVQVRASSGHARLDDTARDTVRRWKFLPAKRGAEPVSAWVLVPISFRLEG